MPIKKILLEISKTLRELMQIQKERLDLEKETIRDNKEELKEAVKIRDLIIGKGEEFQQDILGMLGVKEKIEIDGIDFGDDKNK